MAAFGTETTILRSTVHGLSTHPLWATWYNMVARCTNPGNRFYVNYGGRGIRVCDRWLGPDGTPSAEGAANFIGDMGPKPSPQHSIERLDNNGDYEPGNCIWATWDVQAANKRRSVSNSTLDALTTEIEQLRQENEQLRKENEHFRSLAGRRQAR